MSSIKDKEVGEEVQEGESEQLNLFKPSGFSKPEIWQCVSFIAPSAEKRKWKASDSIGTYCTVCEIPIAYDAKKNPKAVERHMRQKHQDLLKKIAAKESKKRKATATMKDHFPREVKKAKILMKADQEHFTKLVARWTACSLRPFSICEDEELQELIDFATTVDGQLKLPSRNCNKTRIDNLAQEIRAKIRKVLTEKCKVYGATSDLWSSRTMMAFMAFTVHFVCDEFQRHNYTLAVKPTVGKHSGNMIRTYMEDIVNEWGLSKNNLGMMLRDSGSNMVKACEDWGIDHFPCIGHSLHLVVGPFLLEKKKTTLSSEDDDEQDEANDECTTDDLFSDDFFGDDFSTMLNEDEMIERVRKIVAKIRKMTRYIKNSTKCQEILAKLQLAQDCERVLRVSLDVRTRWNSTYKMLNRALEIKESLVKFLKYYKSPLGKKEFSGAKTKLDDVNDEEWAIIQGICHLLGIFDAATKYLSGEMYSSFVSAFPVLRIIKEKIGDDSMFAFDEENVDTRSKFKTNFYGLYGNEPFFGKVVQMLNCCRALLLDDFMERFRGMNASIMWTTLLDPRFSLKSKHWKGENEKTTVKELLMENVENFAAMNTRRVCRRGSELSSSLSDHESGKDEHSFDLFEGEASSETPNEPSITPVDRAKAQAKQEVMFYLAETESINKPKFDPLQWWQTNKNKYPNVAAVARRWLSIPATSTPSERVFSICGIVNMAKRSNLSGTSIENQVFVHNNKSLIDN